MTVWGFDCPNKRGNLSLDLSSYHKYSSNVGNLQWRKSNSYILYLDVVNLYRHCMRQYLPEGNFISLEREAVKKFNVYD